MFEAVGLANEIVDRCFKGTKTRSQGTDFNALYCDLERLHHLGYLDNSNIGSILVISFKHSRGNGKLAGEYYALVGAVMHFVLARQFII